MTKLGINIDHVATLRNARGEGHPDIMQIAKIVKNSGADSITVHLREDRRHIKDRDLKMLCNKKYLINMEMAANIKMMNIAIKNKPKFVCLVPEKRNEVTTEGGLNLNKNFNLLKKIVRTLNKKKIRTSLFINPSVSDVIISREIGTECIEIHTGRLANLVKSKKKYSKEIKKILKCSTTANKLGIEVHAGHGLDYKTTKILSKINEIQEFNIGHYIIGESIFFGLSRVIKNFKRIIKK